MAKAKGDGTFGLSEEFCILGLKSNPEIICNQYGGSSKFFGNVGTLIIN